MRNGYKFSSKRRREILDVLIKKKKKIDQTLTPWKTKFAIRKLAIEKNL